MPIGYKQPLGLPYHWQHEVSGRLKAAVYSYLDNRIKNTTITDEDITILRDYLHHYVNAPCWDGPGFQSELNNLRASVRELDSATEISAWVWKCLEIGLDPL